jgi:hypothetical protein
MATDSYAPGTDRDKRLSVSTCRSLVGELGAQLSDGAIEAMRDQLYAIALAALITFERDSDDATR